MNGGCSHSEGESLGDKIDVDSASDSDKVMLEDGVDVEAANEKANVFENEVTIPEIGMKFDSVEEMFQCFKKYAKYKGFVARKRTSKKDEEGYLRFVRFECSQGGKTNRTTGTPLLPQLTNETGCNVKLTSSFGRDGKWCINRLTLEHNHDLSPSKALLFRCYREIDEHVKRQLEVDGIVGTGPQKRYNALVIDRARKLRLGEGDAIAMQNYFIKMQAQNSNFFYSMNLDEDGRLKNVFWADGRCREAFKEFGDVVTFDTTYLTNKYDMPVVPFVGVNHHGQSILLGCGLISSETTETFVWLFKTWLACMSDIAPQGIITDQDRAMQSAIEIVFPTTRHRWCLWHVMKKLPEKFGSNSEYESIKSNLQKVVYDTQNSEEFEQGWSLMLDMFKLQDNTWLSGLYQERHRWVPCFVTTNFWAGMSTTQRSEGINAFFDGYVHAKTTLKLFVEQYNHALKAKIHKENLADFRSFSQNIRCATTYDIEKQFQRVYTLEKLKEFQAQLVDMLYCEIMETRESCMGMEFVIHEDVAGENCRKVVRFKVLFQKETCEVSCSCRRFEFRGILCKHALLVLIRNKVTTVPDKYILDRWRKDMLRSHTRIKINYDATQVTSEQLRYKKICAEFSKVVDLVVDDEDCCCRLMEWIENKKNEFYSKKYHIPLKSTADEIDPLCGNSAAKACPKVQDPKQNRAKGRPREKRFKAPMEENSKKRNKKAPESKSVQDSTEDPLPVKKKPRKARKSTPNITSSENVKDGSSKPSQQLGVVSTQESVDCEVLSQNSVQQSPCFPPVNKMENMNSIWGFREHMMSLYPQHKIMDHPNPLVNSSYGLTRSTFMPTLPYRMMPQPPGPLFGQYIAAPTCSNMTPQGAMQQGEQFMPHGPSFPPRTFFNQQVQQQKQVAGVCPTYAEQPFGGA